MTAMDGSMDWRRRSLDGCAGPWTVDIEDIRFDGGKAVRSVQRYAVYNDGKGLKWREVPAPAPQPGRPSLLDAASRTELAVKTSTEAPRAPAVGAAAVSRRRTIDIEDIRFDGGKAVRSVQRYAVYNDGKGLKWREVPAPAPQPGRPSLLDAASRTELAVKTSTEAPRAPAAVAADVAAAPAAATPDAAPAAAPTINLAADLKAGKDSAAALAYPEWALAPAARLLKAALSAPAAASGACSSHPAAPASGAATRAARHVASPAATTLAAGTATPPAPAADAGCSVGVSGFAPHVRAKLLQLLHAAPAGAAIAAPAASPATAAAATCTGNGASADVPRSKLRAEAPPFVPRAALAAAPKRSSRLRADAPPFVPRASMLA